jgi:hypothetical protein
VLAALDNLCLAGHETPGWIQQVRRWAAGQQADRARSAIAIRQRWNNQLWRDLVPELLDAGLDKPARLAAPRIDGGRERSVTQLLHLISAAGFQPGRARRTATDLVLLEAIKP